MHLAVAADLSAAHQQHTAQRSLLDWDLMTVEMIWVQWTHGHVRGTSLRQFELCDVAKGSYQKMDTVSNNTQVGWAVRTQGAEKILSIPLHHHHQPELQFWWAPVFQSLRFLFLADRMSGYLSHHIFSFFWDVWKNPSSFWNTQTILPVTNTHGTFKIT